MFHLAGISFLTAIDNISTYLSTKIPKVNSSVFGFRLCHKDFSPIDGTNLLEYIFNTSITLLCFQQGNDFGEEFDELQYTQKQVMIIKLQVSEPKIVFDPPFRDCRDIILKCFSEIIASGDSLPRVECDLFPDMRGQRLLLRSVKLEENLVTDYMDRLG